MEETDKICLALSKNYYQRKTVVMIHVFSKQNPSFIIEWIFLF